MLEPAEQSSVVARVDQPVDMLQAALDLAEQTLRVFPVWQVDAATGVCLCSDGRQCPDPGKHPHVKAWQVQATDDASVLRKWWTNWPNANIGLVTGATNGFVVADFDPRHGGDKTLAELEAANGGPFQTVTAISGSGGVHLFFAVPADSRLRNGRGIRPGLDRRGNGGYVVCSPSLHESLMRYRWAAGFGLGSRMLSAPEWLDEPEIERGEPDAVPLVLPVTLNARELARIDRYARRALDLEANAVRTAPKGTRNDRLNEAAFCLGTLVGGRALEQGLVEGLLVNAAQAAGLGAHEIQKTIRSGITAGMKRPRGVPERSATMRAAEPTDAQETEAPAWTPTVDDPISGAPYLSKVALATRERYLDLAAQAIEWTWQDILVAGTIGVIGGSPSSGKTTLAFLYAAARASRACHSLLGKDVGAAHACQRLVIIEAEHSEPSAARKVLASLRLLGISDAVLSGQRIITVARKAVTLGSAVWREVMQLMAAGLVSDVIVDTLARFAPSDANDEQQQVALYDQLGQAIESCRVIDVPRPTCLLVAHTRKGGDAESVESLSGSIQRVGQCDTLLLCEAAREGGRVVSTRVSVPKLREDPGDNWPLAYQFSIRGGQLSQSLAPVKADGARTKGDPESDARKLIGLLAKNAGVSVTQLRQMAKAELKFGHDRCDEARAVLERGFDNWKLVNQGSKNAQKLMLVSLPAKEDA